jgi:hypothetical protein
MNNRSAINMIIFVSILICGSCSDDSNKISATPNSKILDNLDLILGLEADSGRHTILTGVGGAAQINGRVVDGDSWGYIFTDFSSASDYIWKVRSNGDVDVYGPIQLTALPDQADIIEKIVINSDEAIELAMKSGADDFVARYPSSYVRVGFQMMSGLPVCQLIFEDPTGSSGICSIQFWIHATTKELLAQDINCLR